MSTKYKIRDQTKLHFITFAVVGWVGIKGLFTIEKVIENEKYNGLQTLKGIKGTSYAIAKFAPVGRLH
ncbi:MAG: hypothetical protein L3J06_01500 [Cyclobacteriaceae bacterium]|nr:hypothetical protein [Cyclobacteriaceae bacterium]